MSIPRTLAVLVALAHAAHADPCPKSATVVITIKPDAELKDLVPWASGVTCSKFVVDPMGAAAAAGRKVTIDATVDSPMKLSPDEAYDVFVAALATMGLRVTPRENVLHIVEAPRVGDDDAPLTQIAVVGYVFRPDQPRQLLRDLHFGLSLEGTAGQIGRAVFIADHPHVIAKITTRATQQAHFAASIQKVDDTTFEVTRALVDEVFADPQGAMDRTRVVPAMKNGKPEGLKVYAIRPASLWAKLGVLNGDTLTSINGFDLSSMDQSLEVFAKVRNAKAIEVKVIRRGKPVILKYTVR
jgi:hypothetical protein